MVPEPVVSVQLVANILALDQSSRITGYAVFKDNQLEASGKFTVEGEIPSRLVKIRNTIEALIRQYDIDKVILEDIQLQAGNVVTYKVLAEVMGVLEELCQELNIPHEIISSQTWKSTFKLIAKKREFDKKNAQEYVANTFGKKVTQDESDAICLGAHYIKQNKSAW